MKGIVRKDEEGNFIVVYHKECVEDSDAVIRVSCKIISDYRPFKDGDYIEFELVDIVTDDDGSFASFAIPTLKINPHISSIVNKDNEVDKKDMTLIEKFKRLKISQKNTTATLNIDLDTAKECEQIADDYAIEFAEWININYFVYNTWEQSKTIKELLEIFKKEKGL